VCGRGAKLCTVRATAYTLTQVPPSETAAPAETNDVAISKPEEKASRMSAKSPTRPAPSAAPAAPAKRGSLRWVRDVLGRSLRLEQRKNQLHVALVDPRAQPEEPMSPLRQQRAELGARLLVHDPATQIVRNLFIVHDELRANGWPGVETLPLKVISRSLGEAEILAVDEPSELWATIVAKLREIKTAADARAAREALDADWEVPQMPEVSDTNFDEYELMERSWAGTVPAGLDLPRGNSRM
jgi:hypothetical protein